MEKSQIELFDEYAKAALTGILANVTIAMAIGLEANENPKVGHEIAARTAMGFALQAMRARKDFIKLLEECPQNVP